MPCAVSLLFSRPILAAMGMHYDDVAGQKVCLDRMGLTEVKLKTSPTGHPALIVNEYGGTSPPALPDSDVYVDRRERERES